MLSATAAYTFSEVFGIQTLRLQALPAGAVPTAVLAEHLVGVHPPLNSLRPQPANRGSLSSAFLEHLNLDGCCQDQLGSAGVKVLSSWCPRASGGGCVQAATGATSGTTILPGAQGVQESSVIVSR